MNMTTDEITTAEWSNADNADFYSTTPLNLLPDFAMKGGLNTGCDIDLIDIYIAKAKEILEVGAGYGRVIKKLLDKNYQGKIIAIERSLQFCQLLRYEFENNSNIEIINTDIQSLALKKKVDLILWLWAGLPEFAKKEQLLILKSLFSCLNSYGNLIVDIVPTSITPLNTQHHDTQNWSVCVNTNNAEQKCHVYIPTHVEMLNYAKALGASKIERLDYLSLTKRQRSLYVFKKSN